MDLRGASAIVTGAGSGVGRALACAFARGGARVTCAGRRVAALDETRRLVEADGGTAIVVPADVTDRASVERMAEETLVAFGAIDVLFANAGSFRSVAPVWEADPELWWSDVTTNLLGTMLCVRAVLPHMRERDRGVIITMDGGGGAHGTNPGGSGYGASKAAIVRLTEALARESELDGSHVLSVGMNPGFVRTAMIEQLVATPTGRQWQTHVVDHLAHGVWREPEECAAATVRLLGILGPDLNGCTFSVDTDFDAVARRRDTVREEGLLTLRLRDEGLCLPQDASTIGRAAATEGGLP